MDTITFGKDKIEISNDTDLRKFSHEEVELIVWEIARQNKIHLAMRKKNKKHLHFRDWEEEDYWAEVSEVIARTLVAYDIYLAKKRDKGAKQRLQELKEKGVNVTSPSTTKFPTAGSIFGYMFNASTNKFLKHLQAFYTNKRKGVTVSLSRPIKGDPDFTLMDIVVDKRPKRFQPDYRHIAEYLDKRFSEFAIKKSAPCWARHYVEKTDSLKISPYFINYWNGSLVWGQAIEETHNQMGAKISEYIFKQLKAYMDECLIDYGKEYICPEDYLVA